MLLCYDSIMSIAEKQRTTVYISSDVLEFLKLRSVKGNGSVSQQLENLARNLMPKDYSQEDVRRLERKHAEGYARHPATEEEFSDLYAEQDLSDL